MRVKLQLAGKGLPALPKPGLDAAALLQRWRNLPRVDPETLRHDVDTYVDSTL